MRICLFTSVFLPDVGGAELAIDALARGFQAAGHEPVVLACGKPAELDVPYPVRWAARPVLPHWFPERIGKHLRKAHREFAFDVVHCNYTHPNGYAAVRLAGDLNLPVVIGSQGGDLYHSSKHRNQPHLWKRTVAALAGADGLVAISPHMEALMCEICPGGPGALPPIEPIPNGVDIAAMAAPAPRPADFNDPRPFMLCLGNIGAMKGFDDALAAFAKCREELGDMILLVVGDGPMAGQIRQQARDLELGGHVLFMGQRVGDDKRWFLQNCRFGVMPSIEEGLPLVGLEFMASGQALLCSTNPSFDELVTDDVNGLRVSPQAPDELAAAMVKLAAADREPMGVESRRRTEAFDWSRIAERYLAFFERLIAQRATRQAPSPSMGEDRGRGWIRVEPLNSVSH